MQEKKPLMNKLLTKEALSQYIVKNSKYYKPYLEKFNEKQHFYSWNWAALLIPQIWLPYRKQWGLFTTLFLFMSMGLFINYLAIIEPYKVSPYLLLVISVITLVFLLYLPLKANQKVLEQAARFNGSQQGKSVWYIVLIACLIFTAPIQLFLYKVGVLINKEQQISMLENLSNHQDSDQKILKVLNAIPSDSLTPKAKKELLCYNNKKLLSALSVKKISFSADELRIAYQCKAVNTVTYIVQRGINPTEKVVEDAIYHKNIDMVRALLDPQPQITQQYLAYALQADKELIDASLAEYLFAKTKDFSKPYKNDKGDTISALAVATVNYANPKWAERLLKAGANPNVYLYGNTSLLYEAISKQSLDMIELLLQYKADPSPSKILERAIRTNNPHVVEKILQAGAPVSSYVMKINTELHDGKFKTHREHWNDAERQSSTRITQLLKDYLNK